MRLLGTSAVTLAVALTLTAVGCSTVEPPVDVPPEPELVRVLALEHEERPVERDFVQSVASTRQPLAVESQRRGAEADFAFPETAKSPEDFLDSSPSDEERDDNPVESEHIPPTP